MKTTLALWVLAGVLTLGLPAAAQDPKPETPEATRKRDPAKEPSMVLYAAALPFLEYLSLSGPTRAGFAEAPGHIGTAATDYDAALGPPRGRMTPGSSHLGVRGSLPLFEATSTPLQSSSRAHWSSLVRSHPLAANYAHYPGRALLELDR
jgi:hypothetical protein